MDYPSLIWFQNQCNLLKALLLNEKDEPRFTFDEIIREDIRTNIGWAILDYQYKCIDEIFTVCSSDKEQIEYFEIFKELIFILDRINQIYLDKYSNYYHVLDIYFYKGFIATFEKMLKLRFRQRNSKKFYFSNYVTVCAIFMGGETLKKSGKDKMISTFIQMEDEVYQVIERSPQKIDYQWQQDKKSKSMLFDLALMIVYSGLVEIPTAHNHEEKEVKFVQDLGRYFGIDFTDAHSKKNALLKTKNKREILSLLEKNFNTERNRKRKKELK